MTTLNQIPVVKAEMLIRTPVEDVFEAFADPAVTTKFWFTKSSGRLEPGRHVKWEWEMYGVADDLLVKEIEKNKRIRIEWSDTTETEWTFVARGDNETFVTITSSGYTGSGDDIVNRAVDDMGGYTIVLCGLKAYLEHGIALNLVADKAPDANVNR
ncbi:SRPBCC family protein [Paenibacillus arenilitoris]|uniref:SRPBCC family protein n=1 Tax=Paenibacillus arenilitoris TaxID=2772299 RepID=A0A927CGS0_9BACL|nr:SRPBCC family protein [Paenibacillus arenilitoris]MBD2867808.1 SRPBCC family protein [Paenibacillus arenilitoris]